MKKFIVALVTVVAIFSLTARAEVGDKQFIVIKNGDNVVIYTVRDRGVNSYGNKDATIDLNSFVNPTVRELQTYEVPEEAWKMCSMSENGAYDSYVTKAEQDLTEVKVNYENEIESNKDLEETIGWYKVYLLFLVIGLVIGLITIATQRSKIYELKKK